MDMVKVPWAILSLLTLKKNSIFQLLPFLLVYIFREFVKGPYHELWDQNPSVSPLLHSLQHMCISLYHWSVHLLVPKCDLLKESKMGKSVLCNWQARLYLAEHLSHKMATRPTHSLHILILRIVTPKKAKEANTRNWAFSVVAHSLWNSLPTKVHQAPSISELCKAAFYECEYWILIFYLNVVLLVASYRVYWILLYLFHSSLVYELFVYCELPRKWQD